MQKPKYATNKDLLAEIHRSKITFCEFISPDYTRFDAIVRGLDEITPEIIAKAQAKRYKGEPDTNKEIVVRVMNSDHIPLDPLRKRKPRGVDISYARTNFAPFKHYLVVPGEEPVEVGRSHWKGDFETGVFSPDRGMINNRLAMMFMLLVERYSRRGNWRGYSYVDEMRSHALVQLSQVGLQFDESKSDNPFAFYTTTIKNCFTRVLNLEKRNQHIRDEMLIMAGTLPSYSRQIDHEMEQRALQSGVPLPPPLKRKRPGPKKKDPAITTDE